MSNKTVNRRDFMNRAATTAAAAQMAMFVPRRAFGANERLNVGIVGSGSRGQGFHIPQLHGLRAKHNVDVIAVCDPWQQQREAAAAKVEELFGHEVRQFENWRDLLALKDIDAITIAACDHLHCPILSDAIQAGMDVYCEKPLGVNLKQLNSAVDIVKASDRVVQVGTQRRSEPQNVGCKQWVQAGKIGRVINANLAWNSYKPYWHGYVRPVSEETTNWQLFLFDLENRPFDADQHCCWYGYRGFTSGPIGGWMSHLIDLTHFITGCGPPRSAVTMGGILNWKDQRTCPDTVHTILEYPEGFTVNYQTVFGNRYGYSIKFIGMKGMADVTRAPTSHVSGEGAEDPGSLTETEKIPHVEVPGHFENWLDCVRSRETPVGDIDSGHMHAVACILSDDAMVHNRRMLYDPDKREIRPYDKDDGWLDMEK